MDLRRRRRLNPTLALSLLLLAFCSFNYVDAQSCAAFGSSCAASGPVSSGPPTSLSAVNQTSAWPPKPSNTLRLAASLGIPNDLPSVQMMEAYQFWAYSVNKAGGIPVGAGSSQRRLKVDFRALMDNMDATLHAQNMIEAVKIGDADFLLGGSTHLAASDWNASVVSERITMLCCHGPPLIYEQAMNATQNSTVEDYLFGIQINNEQYPITLIREIALNQKAKLIALPVLNSQNPDQNLFTNTTCQSAINELISINSSGLYDAPPGYEVFLFDISQSKNLTYFKEMAQTLKSKTVNGVNFDMVIACTLDNDGRTLMEALQVEEVPLKGVFSTVMPTSPPSVDYVAQCKNVTMADVLSASQWHPELPFIDETPNAMWPSATAFAEAFQSWSPTHTAATYTHAGAAAAAFAIQVAITDAFAKCDLSSWNGEVSQLLYGTKWPCAGTGNPPATGYSLVLTALRRIHRDSFWGTIQFDSNQRNNGRDTVTVQLLPLNNRVGGNTFQSINFGCDANGNTTLIQEAVLPSQYETKAIVLPRPPRSYDRPCPDGQGLDANNDCQLCQPGTARGALASSGSSKWYCNACNLTSYADSSGMAYCLLCPPGTRTNIIGASSVFKCECVGGYYNQTGMTGVPCSTCPAGATCPGGIDPPQPLPGYWTNSSLEQYSASVFACNPPEACVNDFQTGQICAEGWGGPLCSLCGYNNAANPSNAYHLVFGSCMRCGSTATNVLSFLGILALWVFLKMFLLAKWRTAGFLVGWMQMMSVMNSVNAKWPTSLENFFNVAAFFAFGVNIVGFQCLDASWNFLNDMVLQFLLPVFFILIILASVVVAYLWTYFGLTRKRRASSKDKSSNGTGTEKEQGSGSSVTFAEVWSEMKEAGWSWNSIAGRILGILEITFVPSTEMAMSGLRYKYVSGVRVVAKAPYTAQSTAIIVLSTIGLCIYSIAYPTYIFIRLWSCSPGSVWRRGTNSDRRRHEDPGGFREKENLQLLGWMYDLLRVERFYLALMHLCHRFVYIALMTLITDPAVQLVLSLLWTFLFAAIFAVAPPYFHKRFNILVGMLYLTVVIVLGCGTSFYSPYAVFEGSGWVSGFEVLAFVAIGLGAFVFIWVGIVELMEMMSSMVACEVMFQHLPYSFVKCTEGDVVELADVFNQARLWSWVRKEVHNATGRWANYHVLLWHAIGRSFGFTKSSTNTLGIDSENIQKSKVYRFIMAASKMSKYLSRENELGRMSVTGDAKLWRHISEQHPDIMVFLFNEPDQVAGHWNAFFQVFYSWYWGIREDKPDRSKILKPVMTYLSTFKRNNKLHLDAERQEDEVSYRVPGKKLPLRRQSPEVTSLDQLIMHKHKGVISNWLAMFSTNSEDQVLFKTVVASMANQDYTSFTEMVSRLLHFQAASWKAHPKYKRETPLKLVYNLLPPKVFENDDLSPADQAAHLTTSAGHND